MEDKSIGYEARQTWEGNGPVTVIRYRAEGFTKEHWEEWLKDPIGIQCTLNKRLTATKIEDNEDTDGHPTYHIEMHIPIPFIANRSIITSFYEQENEDGSLIRVNSS